VGQLPSLGPRVQGFLLHCACNFTLLSSIQITYLDTDGTLKKSGEDWVDGNYHFLLTGITTVIFSSKIWLTQYVLIKAIIMEIVKTIIH